MNEYEEFNKTIPEMEIIIEGNIIKIPLRNKFAKVIKYATASIEDIYLLSQQKFNLKKSKTDNKE